MVTGGPVLALAPFRTVDSKGVTWTTVQASWAREAWRALTVTGYVVARCTVEALALLATLGSVSTRTATVCAHGSRPAWLAVAFARL